MQGYSLGDILLGLFNRPLKKLVYFLSGLLPRDPDLWLIGAQKRSFSCNPKYLFLAAQESAPSSVRCVWAAQSREVHDFLRERGYPVVHTSSLKGMWYCLRAGAYFVNCDFKDVSFYLSRKAFVFNLWHGIPLKKIQLDNERHAGNRRKRLAENNSLLLQAVFPFESRRYSRVLSTSDYVTEYSFASAFGIPGAHCVALGYPRTDVFFWPRERLLQHVARNECPALAELMEWVQGFARTIVYMPTWRDTDTDFVAQSGLDLAALQQQLEAQNACLILKFHPYTRIDLQEVSRFANIRLMDRRADIYPLLPLADTLITDYSSIYFDFLLLDREIIFFAFDYAEYVSECRDLYLDFESVTPGVRVFDFAGLQAALSQPEDRFAAERQALRTRFWGDYAGDASGQIMQYVQAELRKVD